MNLNLRNLCNVAKRIRFSDHNNNSNREQLVLMDALETRSLLSASVTKPPVTTGFEVGSVQTEAATKPTATLIHVYTNTTTIGEAVTIAAVVEARSSAIPTGTITFMAGTTVLGTKTLGTDATAKISVSTLPLGKSEVTAVYSGSSEFVTSTSAGRPHTVTLSASTTKLSITSDTTTDLGIATTLLAKVGPATVGGAIPTGRVAFYDGSTVLASKELNSAGDARLTANYLYVGTHNIEAIYLGSNAYLAHRSTIKPVDVQFPTLSTYSDGLQVGTSVPGTGTAALASDYIDLDYTGYLTDGTKFQSSFDPGVGDYSFRPDGEDPQHEGIPGFSEAIVGAKVGETRVMIIPSALAYASNPPSGIPVNATLVFAVEILSISQTAPTT